MSHLLVISNRPNPGSISAAVCRGALCTLIGALAACGGLEQDSEQAEKSRLGVTAVVADVSAGTNPYHRVFRRNWTRHPSEVIPGFPKDAPALRLTFGDDWDANLSRDAAVWGDIKPQVVYWVPGTNLLLYNNSRGQTGLLNGDGVSPIYDDSHGTGTSSTIALTCPMCYILVMYDPRSADGDPVLTIAEKIPWVDFVQSTQIQDFSAEQFVDFEVPSSGSGYASATRALADSGRMFFAATGNTPVTGFVNLVPPLPIFNWDLPPWVVAVGGAYEGCQAVEVSSGRPADFVGDFTQMLAQPRSIDGEGYSSGTSFATPQVAARAALTLIKLRQLRGDHRVPGFLWADVGAESPFLSEGRLTGKGLVDALARAAHYFKTEDYDPTACVWSLSPAPVLPTPWVQMGWGYPSEADTLLAARLIAGLDPVPDKDPAAVAFMDAWYAARATLYGN